MEGTWGWSLKAAAGSAAPKLCHFAQMTKLPEPALLHLFEGPDTYLTALFQQPNELLGVEAPRSL